MSRDYSRNTTILSYFFLQRGHIYKNLPRERGSIWENTVLVEDTFTSDLFVTTIYSQRSNDKKGKIQKRFARRSYDKLDYSFQVYSNFFINNHQIASATKQLREQRATSTMEHFGKGVRSFSFSCCDKWSNVRFNQVWRRRDEQDTTNDKSWNRRPKLESVNFRVLKTSIKANFER